MPTLSDTAIGSALAPTLIAAWREALGAPLCVALHACGAICHVDLIDARQNVDEIKPPSCA
jgi:hypothetical protein